MTDSENEYGSLRKLNQEEVQETQALTEEQVHGLFAEGREAREKAEASLTQSCSVDPSIRFI